MESRVDKATERHQKGYNCAQAVACTYCDMRYVCGKKPVMEAFDNE